jgi:hypothetical protein
MVPRFVHSQLKILHHKKINIMKKNLLLHLIICVSCMSIWSCQEQPQQTKNTVEISGELKIWHKVTLSFTGPELAEYGNPNPFLDYRLNVTFSKGNKKYHVPGYFAADGNAAETSAESGTVWKVHFCPDEEGQWQYKVSFRQGKAIAVSDDESAGKTISFDGLEGDFTITETDKSGRDFRSKGRLGYVGKHYLQFDGTKEYFIKGGADSPENFLAYKEFDSTYYGGTKNWRRGDNIPNDALHLYEPHMKDWNEGDPAWQNGKGKGIIGALNYLASKNMNSVYFLTMNILGDGEDVWPYTDRNERYRFDCSKLDQWEIVFSHMDSLGIMLHVVLQETENECVLDAGYLDVQRKLYLRELVARFAHHLAITWNLGEEHGPTKWSPYGQTVKDTKKMADFLRKTDPYNNFIAIHTHSYHKKREENLKNYLGFRNIEGPSIQAGNIYNVHEDALMWRSLSVDSLHPWVVCIDEIGPAYKGALPDKYSPMHDTIRKAVLWGNLMAGGAGVEWYMGYKYPHNDLNCEDWRSRDKLWEITWHAINFFQEHLPFTEMENQNELTSAENDYCFAKPGEVYAIYLPEGGETSLDLKEVQGTFTLEWYNPRSGGNLITGDVNEINGGGTVSIGLPPGNKKGEDWVALLEKM